MAKDTRTPGEKAEDRRQSAILKKIECNHLSGFMHERIPATIEEPGQHTWRRPARTPGSKSALYMNPGRFGLVVVEIPRLKNPKTAIEALGIAYDRVIDTIVVEHELLQVWLAGGTPALAERHDCPSGWISQDAWVPSPCPDQLKQLLADARSATPTNVYEAWTRRAGESIGDLARKRLHAAMIADDEAAEANHSTDYEQLCACRKVRDAARAMLATADAAERMARRRAAELWQGANRRQR